MVRDLELTPPKAKFLGPLKVSQKKAARAACNEKGNAHCASSFLKLEALQFAEMYKLACGKVAVQSVFESLIPGLEKCFISKLDFLKEGLYLPLNFVFKG